MQTVFCQVLTMSLAGTILWLPIRLLQRLLERRTSPGWLAAFSLPVLCVFLLPAGAFLAASLPSAAYQGIPALGPVDSVQKLALALPQEDTLWTAAAAGTGPGFPTQLAYLWLLGGLLLGLWLSVRQIRFRRWLRLLRTPATEQMQVLHSCAVRLSLRRIPALYRVSGLPTPLGIGLFRPAVYLPETVLEPEELEFILCHELAHIRRKDLWTQSAALLAACIHWYNPCAWQLRRTHTQLCEMACDELAVRGQGPAGRRQYGRTVLAVLARSASPGGMYAPLRSVRTRPLKRRLRRVLEYQPNSGLTWVLVFAAVLTALLPGVLLLETRAAAWTGWDGLSSIERRIAAHNRQYEAVGVSYQSAGESFYYQGQPLSLFLDERPLSQEERIQYPWVGVAYHCHYVNQDMRDGPYLRTVRDETGALVGVAPVLPEEAMSYWEEQNGTVCFDSFSILQDIVYADDPKQDSLSKPLQAWTQSVPPGQAAALRRGAGKGEEGYLCLAEGRYPWTLSLDGDGALVISFYRRQGCGQDAPMIVHYTSKLPLTGIKVLLDGEPVPVED